MKDFEKSLVPLVNLQEDVRILNPSLESLYPVAVVVEGRFQVYDFNSENQAYVFVKDMPLTMPVPGGVRAAFQLEGYGGRIACVVTQDVFDSREGYITLLHEFVHCYQYETCEQDLKMTLDIARQAQEQGDCMWEIQHPFPYAAQDFVKPYQEYLQVLDEGKASNIIASRKALRTYLGVHDYEYMVWQEWKEGFARWVENRVREHLEIPSNKRGMVLPYSRILFYAGGEAYIIFLASQEPSITTDLPGLFLRMLG